MKVKLTGEANDYVGKGMAGGEVTIVPPPNSRFKPEDASLVGNTCLYGATGGRLFVNGRAGEPSARFKALMCFALSFAESRGARRRYDTSFNFTSSCVRIAWLVY